MECAMLVDSDELRTRNDGWDADIKSYVRLFGRQIIVI